MEPFFDPKAIVVTSFAATRGQRQQRQNEWLVKLNPHIHNDQSGSYFDMQQTCTLQFLKTDAGPGPLLQALKAAHETAPPVLPPSTPLVQSPINARDYRPTHYSRQLAAEAAPPTKETREAAQESPQHTTDSLQPAEETHRHTADSRHAVNRKESPHHARQAEGRVQPLGDSAQPFEDLNQPGKEPPQHTDDLEFEPGSLGGSRISLVRWKHFSGCWWQSPSFSSS
ncbi:hypothetical protein KCU93_g2935, partial [Aureobasidium melanogenum]